MEQTEEHAAATILRHRAAGASLSIRLSAAIVTATIDEPRVLTVRIGREPIEALPSGPLEVEHRTLEVGLRAWVERQTSQRLGYVEQLYTFGDRDRVEGARAGRAAFRTPPTRNAPQPLGGAIAERCREAIARGTARSCLRPILERGACPR